MLVRTWRGRWSGSFSPCLRSFEANNACKDLEREVGFTLSPPSVANDTSKDLEWEVGFTLSPPSVANDTSKDLEWEVGFTLSPPSVANDTFEDLEWEVGWVCFILSSFSEAIGTWEREVGLVFLEDNCEGLEFGGRGSSLSTLFWLIKELRNLWWVT